MTVLPSLTKPDPTLVAVRRSPTMIALLSALFMALGGLVACGGTSADDERLQNEKLEDARKQGAQEAKSKADQSRLQRQLDALKRKQKQEAPGGSAVPGTSSAPAAPAAPAGGGQSSCGGGLSVGPSTSCPFAENVKEAYFATSGGSQTLQVFSPTTGREYTMSCSGTAPHVCTGGNGASVYF